MGKKIGERFYYEVELPEDDYVLWDGSGNKKHGPAVINGRLYITTRNLIWTPIVLIKPFGVEAEIIPLSEIQSVEREESRSNGALDTIFAGGLQDRLKVIREDGTTDLLIVDDINNVSHQIRQAKSGGTRHQEATQNEKQDRETAPSRSEKQIDTADHKKHQSESTGSSYCPNCGTSVSDTDDYCSACGAELPNGESTDPSEGFRARVNEEMNEGQIDADPDKSFRERVEEIRQRNQESQSNPQVSQQGQSNPQVSQQSVSSTDNVGTDSSIVVALGRLLVFLFGLLVVADAVGIVNVLPF